MLRYQIIQFLFLEECMSLSVIMKAVAKVNVQPSENKENFDLVLWKLYFFARSGFGTFLVKSQLEAEM